MGTPERIAALKANGEALKEPLRQRYWELDAERQPHIDRLNELQADRDARIDDITPKQDREICAQILAERQALEETREERSMILKALRDDDGKTRLGEPG